MADGKNTIVVYRDWKCIFEKLTDDEAGRLIKHFFAYINDENPKSDRLTELLFEPIKLTLKRDLKHWESVLLKRSEAGKRSAELRQQNQQMSTHVESVQQKSTNSTDSDSDSDSVSDSVSDSDTVSEINNNYKSILLSKINISDYPSINVEHFEIAKGFQQLFRNNLIEARASTATIDKAKGSWIDDVRLMLEVDKVPIQDMRDLFTFLRTDNFWKQNILSIKKLREKYPQLKLKINGKQTANSKQAGHRVTDDYKANIACRILGNSGYEEMQQD